MFNDRSQKYFRRLQKAVKRGASNLSSHRKIPRSVTRFTSRAPTLKVREHISVIACARHFDTRHFYLDATPLSQLNPKKKVFETIQPGFTTLDTHEAAWINPVSKSVHRIRTKEGVCIAPTFVGASLS